MHLMRASFAIKSPLRSLIGRRDTAPTATTPESKLYQVRYRYLQPTLGRWLSRDPVGELAGPNLYPYVLNNPIRHSDPTGQDISLDECKKDATT